MTNRLKRLDLGEAPMSQYIKRQKDKQELFKKFSTEDQNKLENVVETMSGLKNRVKKEMALIKVIDLTKKESSAPP